MSDNPPIKHPSWLTSGDFTEADDPFVLFAAWMSDATAAEPRDANAMAVATVDADGLPDVRMVLLKGLDERGFVFYTNLESQKGRQLAGQPKAALVFHWKSLNRQVRARGPVERVSDAEADAYFATRPRGAQVGAWASRQSAPLASRAALEEEVAKLERRYGVADIPRPPHWSGFRLLPQMMEFWHDRPFRLHDRIVFERKGSGWSTTRLYP